MRNVTAQIRCEVASQVLRKLRRQAWTRVRTQVWEQTASQITEQIWGPDVRGEWLPTKIFDQVLERVKERAENRP